MGCEGIVVCSHADRQQPTASHGQAGSGRAGRGEAQGAGQPGVLGRRSCGLSLKQNQRQAPAKLSSGGGELKPGLARPCVCSLSAGLGRASRGDSVQRRET